MKVADAVNVGPAKVSERTCTLTLSEAPAVLLPVPFAPRIEVNRRQDSRRALMPEPWGRSPGVRPNTGIDILVPLMRKMILLGGLALASTAMGQRTDWLSYGLTSGETRYSPLNQINTANVNRLGLAWSYDMGSGGGGQEGTPLVSNGTVYGITNWSIVFAVDARTGKERWRWDPQVNQDTVRSKICCGVVNRGLAIYQGMIIAPAIDGRLIALNADTGKPVWEARVAYSQDNYTTTMAPRIARGKVIVGVKVVDRPTRGFFAAYDAATGREAWRFYTVPGDPAKGFENASMRKAAGTWDSEWWKRGGGGAVWDGIAFDAESGLVYAGTGNAEPWAESLRGSAGKDNLYVCSILAVSVETGELKWHYQMVPGDSWDFDSVQQMILADLNINGKMRKVTGAGQ